MSVNNNENETHQQGLGLAELKCLLKCWDEGLCTGSHLVRFPVSEPSHFRNLAWACQSFLK